MVHHHFDRIRRLGSNYDPVLGYIVVGRFLLSFAWGLTFPFLALYLNEDLGIPMILVGLLVTSYSLIGSFSGLGAGILCDKVGRRIILLISLASVSILFFMLGSTTDLWTIVALLITLAIARSLHLPATTSMLADVIKPKARTRAYGLLRVGGNAGFAIGPAVGGLLAASLGFNSLFKLTSIIIIPYFLIVLIFVRETSERETRDSFSFMRNISKVANDHTFLIFCLLTILAMLMTSQLRITLPIYGKRQGLSETQIGLLYSINGLVVVFGQYPMARFIERIRRTSSLALGAAIYVIGFTMVGMFNSFHQLLLAMVVITIGEISFAPSFLTFMADASSFRDRGTYMGVGEFAQDAGRAFGPLLGGVLLDRSPDRLSLVWYVTSAFGVASSVGFLDLGRLMNKSASDKRLHKISNNEL